MDISIVAPVAMLLSFTTFLSFSILPWYVRKRRSFGIRVFLSILSMISATFCPLLHLMLIVFPAIVLLYTVMLVCDPRSCLRSRFCHFLLSVVRRIWRWLSSRSPRTTSCWDILSALRFRIQKVILKVFSWSVLRLPSTVTLKTCSWDTRSSWSNLPFLDWWAVVWFFGYICFCFGFIRVCHCLFHVWERNTTNVKNFISANLREDNNRSSKFKRIFRLRGDVASWRHHPLQARRSQCLSPGAPPCTPALVSRQS